MHISLNGWMQEGLERMPTEEMFQGARAVVKALTDGPLTPDTAAAVDRAAKMLMQAVHKAVASIFVDNPYHNAHVFLATVHDQCRFQCAALRKELLPKVRDVLCAYEDAFERCSNDFDTAQLEITLDADWVSVPRKPYVDSSQGGVVRQQAPGAVFVQHDYTDAWDVTHRAL
jgi:hypothetical protein